MQSHLLSYLQYLSCQIHGFVFNILLSWLLLWVNFLNKINLPVAWKKEEKKVLGEEDGKPVPMRYLLASSWRQLLIRLYYQQIYLKVVIWLHLKLAQQHCLPQLRSEISWVTRRRQKWSLSVINRQLPH